MHSPQFAPNALHVDPACLVWFGVGRSAMITSFFKRQGEQGRLGIAPTPSTATWWFLLHREAGALRVGHR